jgi:hypothetical protein
LSATPTSSLANLAALALPRLLVALLPLQLPEDPVTEHEALEGAERRFDPAIVHDDLEGTTMRGVRIPLSPVVITPPILCHPSSLLLPYLLARSPIVGTKRPRDFTPRGIGKVGRQNRENRESTR